MYCRKFEPICLVVGILSELKMLIWWLISCWPVPLAPPGPHPVQRRWGRALQASLRCVILMKLCTEELNTKTLEEARSIERCGCVHPQPGPAPQPGRQPSARWEQREKNISEIYIQDILCPPLQPSASQPLDIRHQNTDYTFPFPSTCPHPRYLSVCLY